MNLSNYLKNFPSMSYRAINDGRWSIEFISEGCQDILGFSDEQLIKQGRTCLTDILPHSENRFADDAIRFPDDNNPLRFGYVLQTPNSEERRVIERRYSIFDDNGALLAIEGFVTDITKQRQPSSRINGQLSHDRLKGLSYRQQLEATLKNALGRLDSAGSAHSFLFISLDQFQLFNNIRERSVGDDILCQVAARLRRLVRRSDKLIRLGEHEFGLLLVKCDLDDAAHIATVICNTIEQQQFVCHRRRFSLTASIGVAATNEGLDSIEKLLSTVDTAHFAARDCGGNRVHYYRQQSHQLLQQNQELHWALEIPRALAENRFFLEQQMILPVVKTGAVKVCYEVLIRMQDVDGKIIMPGRFLPAAASYNLAVTIDIWVIETLLEKLNHEPAQLSELGLCFINLSEQSICDSAFLEKICGLLAQGQIPANRLCFEISETAAVANFEQSLTLIQRLRGLGCRIALDNFGNGYSSFGYLRDFPVDFIKIDGELIRDLPDDRVNRSIVASINELAHANNKQIIAESVESEAVLEQLREIGVDYAQGNVIAQPDSFPLHLTENIGEAS